MEEVVQCSLGYSNEPRKRLILRLLANFENVTGVSPRCRTTVHHTVQVLISWLNHVSVMLSKIYLLVHIGLIPLYISLAFYFNLIPPTVSDNLHSLFRLAKANLHSQYLKPTATSTTANMPST